MPSPLSRLNISPRIASSDEDHYLGQPDPYIGQPDHFLNEYAKYAPAPRPLDEHSDPGSERTYRSHLLVFVR